MRFALFTVPGVEVDIRVRASTRVRARRVAGMPYFGAGERLLVGGCRSKNGKVIGANRIRRLPPINRARSSACPTLAAALRTMRRAARSSR